MREKTKQQRTNNIRTTALHIVSLPPAFVGNLHLKPTLCLSPLRPVDRDLLVAVPQLGPAVVLGPRQRPVHPNAVRPESPSQGNVLLHRLGGVWVWVVGAGGDRDHRQQRTTPESESEPEPEPEPQTEPQPGGEQGRGESKKRGWCLPQVGWRLHHITSLVPAVLGGII